MSNRTPLRIRDVGRCERERVPSGLGEAGDGTGVLKEPVSVETSWVQSFVDLVRGVALDEPWARMYVREIPG
jgi:hypothetical protein